MLLGMWKILRARIPRSYFPFSDDLNGSSTTFNQARKLDTKRRTTNEHSQKNQELDQGNLRDAITNELELKLIDMFEHLKKDLMVEMKK